MISTTCKPIVGIDIDPKLIAVAGKNIKTYSSSHPNKRPVSSFHATHFWVHLEDEFLCLYTSRFPGNVSFVQRNYMYRKVMNPFKWSSQNMTWYDMILFDPSRPWVRDMVRDGTRSAPVVRDGFSVCTRFASIISIVFTWFFAQALVTKLIASATLKPSLDTMCSAPGNVKTYSPGPCLIVLKGISSSVSSWGKTKKRLCQK